MSDAGADWPLKRPFSSCQTQNNNTNPSCYLPHDLILRIMSFLPSPLLFECRALSKALHAYAPLALSRRPFFVYQAPSSQCFLLPLDSPSTPLPCTFTLAMPSFVLEFASSNLLCMRRSYRAMLDICVCDIFRKWKVTVPPIVDPYYAPCIRRRVFLEDPDVDSLRVIGFHATDHHPHDRSSRFRIFVANNAFLRVFDSCLNQWSHRAHFPAHLCTHFSNSIYNLGEEPTPPHCFIASDGTIILTFFRLGRTLFNYDDLSFHAVEVFQPVFPSFELAGYYASACVERGSFNLEIRLPHVEDLTGSSHRKGLVLKELCKGDHNDHTTVVPDGAPNHRHYYHRSLLHSYCHAYRNTVYALILEQEEMSCCKESIMREPPTGWYELPTEELEKYLYLDAGSNSSCKKDFHLKLMLYTARVDTTDWTMQILSRTDATALLPLAERNNPKVGKFLLMEG